MKQPLYEQAAQYIRTQIATGEYPTGDRIPGEQELSEQLGISRPTLRQALDLLVREGRLIRIQGSGTFVIEPKLIHESTTFVTGYREESRKKHRTLRTRVLALCREKAKEEAAAALGLHVGDPVTHLTRVRRLEGLYGGSPVVHTTVYVPVALLPDMADLDFTDASFYELLDSRGLSVTHASRTLEVVLPPAEVAARLEISPFEPVVYIASVGKLRDGRAVEYSKSYYPASRSSFQIEINR